MNIVPWPLLASVLLSTLLSFGALAQQTSIRTDDIVVRDPFILVDREAGTYYLYAQNGNRAGDMENEPRGVEVYTSTDLQIWTEPAPVLDLPMDAWARKWVWAPEVFEHDGRYYLFVTLTGDAMQENFTPPPWWNIYSRLMWPAPNVRGTQIFHADSPAGPFKPFANKPHTPEDRLALDGTLFVEDGIPYMVFCHEWVQIGDGSIDAVQLSEDLSETVGEPFRLFAASEAGWPRSLTPFDTTLITDGVFFHRTQTDSLVMIWSSNGEDGYALGQAVSVSGKLRGPWRQVDEPLFAANGGHGMLFEDLDGKLQLALHQPNSPDGAERIKLFAVDDSGGILSLR